MLCNVHKARKKFYSPVLLSIASAAHVLVTSLFVDECDTINR
jgi:hypothetical protein